MPDLRLVLVDAAGGGIVPQPRRDALGPARRPGGVVHRTGERIPGEFDRTDGGPAVGGQGRESALVEDAQDRLCVVSQRVAFGRRQLRVQEDRDEADPGRTEDGADQIARGAEGEGDTIACAATPGQQRGGGAPLAHLGVGRMEDFDLGRPGAGHRGSVRRSPVPPWLSWTTGHRRTRPRPN